MLRALLRLTLATLLLGALAGASHGAALPAPPDGPTFVPIDSVAETTDELLWQVPMRIQNTSEHGLYLDSLFLDVTDHDAARVHGPAVTRSNLTFLLNLRPSLSGNEDGYFQYSGPATTEHGTLVFTMLAHDQQGHHWTRQVQLETQPGPYWTGHPSQVVRAGGHRVEVVYVEPPDASTPHPGMLIVHGEGSDARRMLMLARVLVSRGYAVELVSLPGYGGTEGAADFAGPASVAAASAAFDALASTRGVDRTRLSVWGISRGATVALLLAAQRHDVAGVVAQSGVYDPWATWRAAAGGALGHALVAEAGGDSAAWRARAPLLAADRVKAAVFIAHGERDTDVPVAEARALAAALRAGGATVEEKYLPSGTHALGFGQVQRPALDFLARALAAK